MRLNTNKDYHTVIKIGALIIAALLLFLTIALPLEHQHIHVLETDPHSCPIYLLERSLLLLAISIWVLLVGHILRSSFILKDYAISHAPFSVRFFFLKRPPPIS